MNNITLILYSSTRLTINSDRIKKFKLIQKVLHLIDNISLIS